MTGVPARRVTLSSIAIRDFRNIERAELAIPCDGMALVGDNGQGKTNFLEAIIYLELLRSMRGVRDRDLLRFGAPAFHIASVSTGTAAHRVGVGVERTGRKRVTLDGVDAPRLMDALGALPSVCFSPADIALISGAPAERRRYLDIALALSSPRYLAALRHYRAALVRRNAALRGAARPGPGVRHSSIAAWEPALAEHGAVLVEERRSWIAEGAAEFARLCAEIGERGPMRIAYESPLVDAPDVRTALGEALRRSRELDARRLVTHAGPHRDDLAVTLGGRELRLVGSAGQQRTAAIALRLLEAATFRTRAGAQPLLLLDDPFAELDRRRAARVLALLEASAANGLGQTILCVPREDEIPRAFTRLKRWRIEDGVFSADGGST
ncbi:MAG TPA: DNA replication and repair protein RecF [Gemmatimonadaceae bacterium]